MLGGDLFEAGAFPFLPGNSDLVENDLVLDDEDLPNFFEIIDDIVNYDLDNGSTDDLVALVSDFQEEMIDATAKFDIEITIVFLEATDDREE